MSRICECSPVTLSDSEGARDSSVAEFILSQILRSLRSLRMTKAKDSLRMTGVKDSLEMRGEVSRLPRPDAIGARNDK
jgi:hypothetical protein